VPVLDVGLGPDQTIFLVMGYAPGGTLLQRHPKGTLLPLDVIATYVKQIADTLQYTYEHQIVHGQLKPENLLIGPNHELLLSDFGMSALDRLIGPAISAYTAPEQLQSQLYPAGDQYALGVMIYEWLCGRCPFTGPAPELVGQHLYAAPPPLREFLPTISPEVEWVVMTTLAKDHNHRFGSIRALDTAFQQAAQLVPEPVLRTPTPPSPEKPALGATLLIYNGHVSGADAVAWSPDGSRIASGSSDGSVQVWEVATGKLLASYEGPFDAGAPSQPSDRRPVEPQPTIVHPNFISPVTALAWSPGGRHLACDFNSGSVQVWQVDRQTTSWLAATRMLAVTSYGHSGWVRALSWSPDGLRIVSASAYEVQVWEAMTGNLAYTYEGHRALVHALAWSPNSRLIASAGSNDVQVWEATTGSRRGTYTGHAGLVRVVAWSPDGRHITYGASDGTMQIWEAAKPTGKPLVIQCSAPPLGSTSMPPVTSVAWSPDGTRIASASNEVQVWQVN
jgi:WD40 repeat protein